MEPLPTIDGGWACVAADPPWHFRARTALQMSNWTSRRDAEKHYDVLGSEDIAEMPVRDVAAKDAHLFLWTTGPCLRQAFDAEADLHLGLGLTTRKNIELVLLGRRGSCRRNAKDVREVVMAPVRQHSRKPDEVYRRIERYCDGPRLELFGRQSRPGWTVYGNEATKFDAL